LQGDGTILFDGSSDFMKTPTFVLAAPCTIYLRLKQVTWTLNDYILDGFTGNTGVLFQQATTSKLSLYAGAQVAENSAHALDTWGSIGVVFNGAGSVLDINGTATTGNPGAANMAGLTIGSAGSGGGQWANVQVAEIVAYNVAHDTTQRAVVRAYLDTR